MFKIQVGKIGGNVTPNRMAKFNMALDKAHALMNSDAFRVWFYGKCNNQEFTQLYASQKEQTVESLFLDMMDVAVFDYYIQNKPWYKRFSKVIGWSTGTSIFTYSDKFDGMSLAGLTGHLVHEATHDLGFSHSVEWSHARDKSIPYQVGNWIERNAI